MSSLERFFGSYFDVYFLLMLLGVWMSFGCLVCVVYILEEGDMRFEAVTCSL